MGNDIDKSKVLKICVIGGNDEIIKKIFPNNLGTQKGIQCVKRNLYKDIEVKDYNTGKSSNYKVNWEAFIFPNLTEENEESIMDKIFYKIFEIPKEEEILENNKSNISKNNIIIKFGSNEADYFLNYIDSFSRLYLPQVAIITNSDVQSIQDNRFLTIIRKKKNSELYKDIFSYVWERECYFNQRGHLMNEYTPKNHDIAKDLPCSSLNIMLTGMSRSGKSTFINVLSKKLIALETPEFISVTREINEFVIYREVKGQGIIKLKLIDTPGLTFIKEENKDTTDDVIKSIDEKLKEFDDSNESIHIIYFFMSGIPNLEQSKKFFKYLSNLQEERVKKNFPKLPILFIFNRNSDENNYDALKKFLLENKFNNLYEEGEKNEIKGNLSKNKLKMKKKKYIIKDNILGINLLNQYSNEEIVYKAFGIPNLLKATKYFIKKTNPFKEEDFNKAKNIIKEFKIYANKGNKLTKEEEDKLLTLKEECKNLMIQISNENSLLYKLKNKTQIIEKAKNEAFNIIYISSALGFFVGMIPVPFLDIPILYSMNFTMILKIGKRFMVDFGEIPKTDIAKLVFGVEANVQSSAKFVGNGVAAVGGEEFGKNLVKDLGTNQISDWANSGLHIVKQNGNVNVGEVAQSLVLSDESHFKQFINYLYNLFPSFQTGVKDGIENGGKELGKNLKKVLIDNTHDLAQDFVEEVSENVGKTYSEKLAANASGYFSKFTPKMIPVIGSLVGGVLDSYSTYQVGKNCIKYFEDYINKTQGCEFVLKRKEEYEKILNSLDILENDNFANFEINIFN